MSAYKIKIRKSKSPNAASSPAPLSKNVISDAVPSPLASPHPGSLASADQGTGVAPPAPPHSPQSSALHQHEHVREPGHSTGPITAAGKARSALNAFQHGLTARPSSTMRFLSYENPDDHERLRLAFNEQFVPMTPAEHEVIREIVDALWLARRARDLQSLELENLSPDRHLLALYLRYETAHTRAHQAAIKTLLALQKNRRERNQNHEEWNEPVVWGLADSVIFDTPDLITWTEAEAMEAITAPSPVIGTSFRNPASAPTGNHAEPAA